jgi:hypothetical protein
MIQVNITINCPGELCSRTRDNIKLKFVVKYNFSKRHLHNNIQS